MRDLKFTNGVAWLNWKKLTPNALQSAACKASAESYNSNVDRVLGILSLPGYITWVATEWNLAALNAQHSIVGLMASPEDLEANQTQISAQAAVLLRKAMNNPATDPRTKMMEMTEVFETNFSRANKLMNTTLESLLKTALIQVWTTFEVLASDLWESVINEHPHHLANLDGKAGPATNPPPKKDASKQVSLNELRDYKYNLSGVMGTVLKDKYKFTVLANVRDAYIAAFASDRAEIEKVITDKALNALAAVRHLLVHKAGVVDQDFMDDSEFLPVLEPIRALGLKKSALIDGDLVRALVEPVLGCGSTLIYEVDKWLTNHPTPP